MDSCGCVVHNGFESTNPNQEHGILVKYEYICPQHETLHPHARLNHNDDTAYQIAREENNKKNQLLGHLLDANVLPLPMVNIHYTYDRKSRTKIPTISLHENIIYNYYFTGDNPKDRQIIFSLEGLDKNGNVINLDNNVKASIHNVLNKKIGAGKHQMVDILHEELHPEYRRAIHLREMGLTNAKMIKEGKQSENIV